MHKDELKAFETHHGISKETIDSIAASEGSKMSLNLSYNDRLATWEAAKDFYGKEIKQLKEKLDKANDLIAWNVDNFNDLPLSENYYQKWLIKAYQHLDFDYSHLTGRGKNIKPDEQYCFRCGSPFLDTGWECTDCEFDNHFIYN